MCESNSPSINEAQHLKYLIEMEGNAPVYK